MAKVHGNMVELVAVRGTRIDRKSVAPGEAVTVSRSLGAALVAEGKAVTAETWAERQAAAKAAKAAARKGKGGDGDPSADDFGGDPDKG